MKKIFIIAVLILAVLIAIPAFAQQWISGGAFTNPAINTVLAEAVANGNGLPMSPNFICASTVASVAVLEWRDATNATNLKSQYILIPASTTIQIEVPSTQFYIGPNERMRLRLNAAITGSMQCSFIFP